MTSVRKFALVAALSALAGCGTSPDASSGVVIVSSDTRVSFGLIPWVPAQPGLSAGIFTFFNSAASHSDCFPGRANEVHCLGRFRSLSERIALARAAVAADPNCAWVGYDQAFDARARATVGLLDSDDEWLFIAPVDCG